MILIRFFFASHHLLLSTYFYLLLFFFSSHFLPERKRERHKRKESGVIQLQGACVQSSTVAYELNHEGIRRKKVGKLKCEWKKGMYIYPTIYIHKIIQWSDDGHNY